MFRLLPLLTAISLLPAAEPPTHLADWVQQDRNDPLAAGPVVFIGSSSIRRWESLTRDFPGYRIAQRGWGGSWLAEMDEAAPWVIFPLRPSAVVMWAGTNDLSNGQSGEQVHEDFLRFHQVLRAHSPDLPFLFLGATRTPANGPTTAARETSNRRIRATLEADPHGHYVDLPAFFDALGPRALDALYVDRIHLNPAGYDEWVRLIRPALAAHVPPNELPFHNPLAPTTGATVAIDFSPQAADDPARNAAFPGRLGKTLRAGEHQANLHDTHGQPTGLRLTITGDFHLTKTGLSSTGDHLKGHGNDDCPGSLMISGLNPALPCEVHLHGKGGNPEALTEFTVIGRGIDSFPLATGGDEGKSLIFPRCLPDDLGRLWVDLNLLRGDRTSLESLEIHLGKPVK